MYNVHNCWLIVGIDSWYTVQGFISIYSPCTHVPISTYMYMYMHNRVNPEAVQAHLHVHVRVNRQRHSHRIALSTSCIHCTCTCMPSWLSCNFSTYMYIVYSQNKWWSISLVVLVDKQCHIVYVHVCRYHFSNESIPWQVYDPGSWHDTINGGALWGQ